MSFPISRGSDSILKKADNGKIPLPASFNMDFSMSDRGSVSPLPQSDGQHIEQPMIVQLNFYVFLVSNTVKSQTTVFKIFK